MTTEIARIYRDEMDAATIADPWTNHAWGALVGVWVGDAAGATLEGFGRGASDRAITDAIGMVGGGIHNVDPGAVTDDGELTATLTRTLSHYSASYDFPLNAVALAYRDWFRSAPFDVGYTCRAAFGIGDVDESSIGQKMLDATSRLTRNQDSQANGALMRIMPVAVWIAAHARCDGLKTEQVISTIREHVTADARLSHPNQVCVEANILYCIAAVHLINNPGDGLGALAHVEYEIQQRCTSSVVDWYYSSTSLATDNFCINGGHVKHAFRAAFYHLRRRSTYHEALHDVLARGGDTDTNAAIVGGLLGALHGFQLIPDGIKGRVLMFDCMRQFNNNRRPEEYSVFRVWPYFLNMVPAHGPAANTPIVPAKEVRVMKLGHEGDTSVSAGTSVNAADQDNIEAVIRKFAERAHRTDMDSNVDVLDWIERTQQQHMDAILYLEKLKRVVSGGK
jgi:ADP-ribosylglycohydrolase